MMDKKTLSHYGWIVVWILTISVMLAFATPFGKYVGNGIVSIATGFGITLDKEASVEQITEKKENVDTLLNGEFIITDKQGSEDCYVYQVNNTYDAYSLNLSGTTPEIDDKYFRCIRYVDIEEKDEVKEMFYFVKKNHLSSTEQRQGISYYLLSLINETDYTDTVSSLGSIQLNTYNSLKSSKGTLNEDLYEDVELIAIEKDGYIDILLTETSQTSELLGWQVPRNGTYTMISDSGDYGKTVYNELEYLPYGYETQIGDVLVLEPYTYTYSEDENDLGSITYYSSSFDNIVSYSWKPKVNDKTLESYDTFIDNINYQEIINIGSTFAGCKNLKTTPVLSDNIEWMKGTFNGCTSLTTITNIPKNVKNLRYAFYNCTSLTTVDDNLLSSCTNLKYFHDVFSGCSALTDMSNFYIPETVIYAEYTFENCTSLTKAPVFPNSVKVMDSVYYNCSVLTTVPALPINITTIQYVFQNCISLTDANVPVLPSTVLYADGLYSGCVSLVDMSDYTLPDGILRIGSMFKDCTSLIKGCSVPSTVINMSGMFQNCSALADVSNIIIPEGVANVQYLFDCCQSLVGDVVINAQNIDTSIIDNYYYCFRGVDMTNINLIGSCPIEALNLIGATGNNWVDITE